MFDYIELLSRYRLFFMGYMINIRIDKRIITKDRVLYLSEADVLYTDNHNKIYGYERIYADRYYKSFTEDDDCTDILNETIEEVKRVISQGYELRFFHEY